MNKKYLVKLTSPERKQLREIIAKGKAPAYKIKHANILLKAEAGWSDEKIAQAFDCNVNTPRNVRQRLVEQGLDVALERKKQGTPSREKILDGKGEAHLIALSCSQPPEGRARWTLHLLADKLIELQVVDRVSYETVRRTLKKMS
jgi:transposase